MKIFILMLCLSPFQNLFAEELLLALSKGDHTVTFVDTATLTVKKKILVGPDSHEIVVSDDGSTAYISNTGSGKFHEINVIDVANQKPLPNIDTTPLLGVHGLNIVDNKLWFTAEGSKALGRYDYVNSKLDWVMGSGQNRTHLLHVMKSAKKIVTTNVDSGTVSIFEIMTLPPMIAPTGKLAPNAAPHDEWIQTLIPVAKGVEGFVVSPDEKIMWAAAPDEKKIFVIDLENKKIISKIDTKILGIHRMTFTPDGKRVLAANIRSGVFIVFDYKTRKEIKRFDVGRGGAIVVTPDSKRAYVSCSIDNFIAVVDLEKFEVTGKIDVGQRPDGLALVGEQ